MKESEWIVSPKKLRQNQKEMIEKEEKEKQQKRYNKNQIILIVSFAIVFAIILCTIPLE